MSAVIATDTQRKIVNQAMGEFHGGIYPPENKTQSMQLPVGELPLPKELVFPLGQHMGVPADPIVAVGDKVLGNQKIAAAVGGFSAAIHASSSGIVTAIEDRILPHPSGMSGPCIVIATDGKHQQQALEPCDDFRQQAPDILLEKIRDAGITGLGGAGFPTAVKLKPQEHFSIHTLILNGTECEPYITADHSLMLNHANDVIRGAQLLAYILGEPEKILIGVEDNKPDAITALERVIKETPNAQNISIVTFPTKYPSGGEKQLIQLLTNQEVPAGAIPASLGIVMQNVGTTVAAYRAVVHGQPLTSRITTFVGESLTNQQNIQILLGTPIDFALSTLGYAANNNTKLIMGGPMMGFALDNPSIPVIKSTNCIIAPSLEELPAQASAQECIRCGMCAEVCPASLLPQQLYWYAKAEDYERAQNHQLFDCIECGACSYVCPSNIPLVQYYRAAKGEIKHIEQEKVKSDHARQRFEFRKLRIEKAEQEKIAKREARKAAAEKAKRLQKEKLAQQASEAPSVADATANTAPAADPVAAAMARVKEKQNDPVAQQAKLERAVSSAKDRVAKLEDKLTKPLKFPTGTEEEHRDRIGSQVKQAKVRQQDAEKQLADFLATVSASATTDTSTTTATATNAKAAVTTVEAKPADAPKNNDAASSIIEKAKATSAALASMSPKEKLQHQIESLEQRLNKAQTRLQNAEKDNSEHVDAFKTAAEKLEKKLASAKEELTTL
jgi:electron transport complex protein RnfC